MELACRPGACTALHVAPASKVQACHSKNSDGSMPAGLVDALGIFVTLPMGTEQIFLSMAFGLEGFLMLLHKKHEPVDLIAHELLGYTMVAGDHIL